MPGRGRPFRPGQSGNPAGGRKLARHTWPRARDILHKSILTNQPEFEQKVAGPAPPLRQRFRHVERGPGEGKSRGCLYGDAEHDVPRSG
jgi:hypothetical protein